MAEAELHTDYRRVRARKFAATVMAIIDGYVQRKQEARDALEQVAYDSDVVIVPFSETK